MPTLVQAAANDRSPEGFSMRAGVQGCPLALSAARVDKPRKEEAAAIWDQAMGKERQRVRLTLPWARGRLCRMRLLQSFSATLVASISPIERA